MPSIGNALEVIEKGMEDNIYNFTKEGKCSGCGNCCSNFLPMSQKEIDLIHRYIDKYHIKECIHTIPLAKHTEDWTCPFRDNTNSKCTIYEVRPEICRQFICDSEKRAKHNRKLLGQTRVVIDVRSEFYGSQGIR